MEGDIKDLSFRLYETLEMIGGSEEMRQVHNENVVGDILQSWACSVLMNSPSTAYICGSWCEGTTTPGMGSDMDRLDIMEYINVIVDISEAGRGPTLLMVESFHSQPGYFKLQMVRDRVPQNVYHIDVPSGWNTDRSGRICKKHIVSKVEKRHGPADTGDVGDGYMVDDVTAFRCSSIPDSYTEWMNRRRPHGWPPRRLLDKMGNLSCFVVGVGHERSEERDIEWRLSFSLQERELMLNLNPVQHKCYILMKLIKKDIIQPSIGGSDAISSYHCKTCLFYAIENSHPGIWRPDNLIPCLVQCLNVLYECAYNSNCPNYFMPHSNMFDRDIFRRKRCDILQSLHEILRLKHEVVFLIKTDDLRDILAKRKMFDKNNKAESRREVAMRFLQYPIHFNLEIMFKFCFYYTTEQNILFLSQCLDFLWTIKCVRDHTEHQTREAVSYVTPWVHQRLAVALASLAFKINHDQVANQLLSKSDHHFRRGLATDLMNTRLMYVTVLFKLGKYEMCMEILEKIDMDFTRCVVSVCVCRKILNHGKISFHANRLTDENLSIKDTMYETVASCIKFLPSEINIVPPPLQYEMFRSLYTLPGSRDEYFENWFDWAVVDAKVFLFFMQYLVFSRLDLNANKEVAVEHLEWVINTDIKHRETAYNLLGWIYLQEHRLEEAVRCWGTSLAIRPVHNAAKYHVSDLLNNIQV